MTFLFFLSSCDTSTIHEKPIDPIEYKEPLINANQELVATEKQDIHNYMDRHGWKMTETGSGLHYMIYQQGYGDPVQEGKVIRYNYETGLLTGKTCYRSEENGPREFLVGQGGVESGLEEAVLLLREGDRVKIIIPSHLAFGLLGDEDCIPKKAVVVYDLEIVNVLDPTNLNKQ